MDENINEPKNKKGVLPNIKTYTSDMAEVIREKEISVIKIAMAEKEKREREELILDAEPSGLSKFFLIFGGLILLVGSIVGIYFFSIKKNEVPTPIENIKNRVAIISYDEEITIDTINKDYQEIKDLIKLEKEKVGKLKSIRVIFLISKINNLDELLTLDNIFSISNISIPAPIKRSLSGEYMLGVYTPLSAQIVKDATDESLENKISPNLFLILKTTDYNISYAGMLNWESTMTSDLANLFSFDKDMSGTFQNLFEDVVINNKDARVLKNSQGQEILYYLFTDKNTLVITNGNESARELTTRIINKK